MNIKNAWFQPLAKTTKCSCGERAKIYAWGEYLGPRWHTVLHFCFCCFERRVLSRLRFYAKTNNCTFECQPRSGYSLPIWLKYKE